MEDNAKQIEILLARATEYGTTSLELMKLKVLDKTTDVVSSIIPHAVVFVLFTCFLLFVNLGLGFWLGKILGNTFYGFFVVAAFYGLIGLIVHLFMHRWLKKKIGNYIINQALKN